MTFPERVRGRSLVRSDEEVWVAELPSSITIDRTLVTRTPRAMPSRVLAVLVVSNPLPISKRNLAPRPNATAKTHSWR